MQTIRLKPRLEAACGLLPELPEDALIADIGCDHGQLICSLLRNHPLWNGIATDISEPSLKKAERLAEVLELQNRLICVSGDGFQALGGRRPDAVFLCGMGGEGIVSMLEQTGCPLGKGGTAILQPMRGIEELREYLYRNCYHIVRECIVPERGKWYQIFSVTSGTERQKRPEGFPENQFLVGYKAFEDRIPFLEEYVNSLIRKYSGQMEKAAGTDGERILAEKIAGLRAILDLQNG